MPFSLTPGDRVRIIDPQDYRYNQRGTIISVRGNFIWLEMDDLYYKNDEDREIKYRFWLTNRQVEKLS